MPPIVQSFEDAERVLHTPHRWDQLSNDDVEGALVFGVLGFGLRQGERFSEQVLTPFLVYALERLDVTVRLRLVTGLGEMLERSGREQGTCPGTLALLPFIHMDDDPAVISTAALTAAQLIDALPDDPLNGPRQMIELARRFDGERRAAVMAGLTQLGDPRVFALVRELWAQCGDDTKRALVGFLGAQMPSVATFDLLIAAAEEAPDNDGRIGSVAGSLRQLILRAREMPGRFAGHPILDLERVFPAWAAPDEDAVLTVKHAYGFAEFAPHVAPRLQTLSANETYPRVLPQVLADLGAEDTAFVDAVGATVAATESDVKLGLLPGGPPVPMAPSWVRPDAVVEWGILNPNGPTLSHLLQVPLDADRAALVYAMHNPFAYECYVVATVPRDDHEATLRAVVSVAKHFQFGDSVLLQSLPHWVALRRDVPSAVGVEAFRVMYQTACSRGIGNAENPAAAIEELQRLRAAPLLELQRQLQDAMSGAARAFRLFEAGERDLDELTEETAPRSAAAWSAEDYDRWFAEASAADHVASLSPYFMECWNIALRMARSAANAAE